MQCEHTTLETEIGSFFIPFIAILRFLQFSLFIFFFFLSTLHFLFCSVRPVKKRQNEKKNTKTEAKFIANIVFTRLQKNKEGNTTQSSNSIERW